jgi:hypothetical protein
MSAGATSTQAAMYSISMVGTMIGQHADQQHHLQIPISTAGLTQAAQVQQ